MHYSSYHCNSIPGQTNTIRAGPMSPATASRAAQQTQYGNASQSYSQSQVEHNCVN